MKVPRLPQVTTKKPKRQKESMKKTWMPQSFSTMMEASQAIRRILCWSTPWQIGLFQLTERSKNLPATLTRPSTD